jgi:hypothetical protein
MAAYFSDSFEDKLAVSDSIDKCSCQLIDVSDVSHYSL